MSDKHVTRRRLLRNTAAGVTATGMAGTAVAQGRSKRKIVGLNADAPFGLARKAASEVTHELDFDRVGKVVSGTFSAEAVEGLEKHPNVRYVEDEGTMQALAQTLPWGVDRVDADVLHSNGETGNGADIAIIDTGIDADHPDLQANLGTGEDFTGTGSWDDDNGHGTHCAGIADAVDNSEGVVGVSTEATLHAVKVLDSQGSGTYSDIAAGIEWVADQGYDVGSMSLGGSSGSSALQDAVQYAQSNGVLLIAAAGNSGPCSDCVGYPAAYSEVMAVSSTNSSDGLSSFSSTGPEVEIAAPGSDIYSTYNDGGYNTLSGTSMACPHVSGAAGQLMANGYTNSEARQTMKDTAEDLGLASNEQGAGLLDAEAAVTGGGSDPVLTVYTDSATGVGETAATLNGTLNELGGASSADVYFEWGEAGSGLPNTTSTQTLTSTGSFSDDISGLNSGTDYEFRAVANGSDGSSDTGATASFTTDSGDGGCFITTATAGEGHTLNSLRRFRDESMSATPVGRGLVGLYYRISPPIAETLERNPRSLTARATRSIVDRCASLSDRQDETDSAAESALLGVALTMLYVVGILVGAGGHAGIRTRELLDSS
ncbi:S8 family peptidase [Halosolutus halophilus]|uniref:S8 family peptidase n=1 Tax=Halosolutus halophilus TaxID=1552990 RepID=UPI002234ED78|nr:S8 family peptidase [Halosolutus halophilus]